MWHVTRSKSVGLKEHIWITSYWFAYSANSFPVHLEVNRYQWKSYMPPESSSFTSESSDIMRTMLANSFGCRACRCLRRLDVLPCGWRRIRLHMQHQKSLDDSWSKWTFISDERESAYNTPHHHMLIYNITFILLRMTSTIRQCVTQSELDSKDQKRTLTAALD